jgi:hypothetical protein
MLQQLDPLITAVLWGITELHAVSAMISEHVSRISHIPLFGA